MIRQTKAETLPTGASDILLALEHLPCEDDLAFGLESAHYLILNRGHWELITQDHLPTVASPHVLSLGQLSRLTLDHYNTTVTEAVTEAVRDLLAQQDVRTRYVHELDNAELIEVVKMTSRSKYIDTAGELLRHVYIPELKRRKLNDEVFDLGREFFWYVIDVAAWERDARRLFYRAIQNIRKGLDGCDNYTLMGEVTSERATNLIRLAVLEHNNFDVALLRDAIAMVKESPELDSNPGLNILQDAHQDICECFDDIGWFWRWRTRNCRSYTVKHLKRLIELSEKRIQGRILGYTNNPRSPIVMLRTWFDHDPDLLVAMLQVR